MNPIQTEPLTIRSAEDQVYEALRDRDRPWAPARVAIPLEPDRRILGGQHDAGASGSATLGVRRARLDPSTTWLPGCSVADRGHRRDPDHAWALEGLAARTGAPKVDSAGTRRDAPPARRAEEVGQEARTSMATWTTSGIRRGLLRGTGMATIASPRRGSPTICRALPAHRGRRGRGRRPDPQVLGPLLRRRRRQGWGGGRESHQRGPDVDTRLVPGLPRNIARSSRASVSGSTMSSARKSVNLGQAFQLRAATLSSGRHTGRFQGDCTWTQPRMATARSSRSAVI